MLKPLALRDQPEVVVAVDEHTALERGPHTLPDALGVVSGHGFGSFAGKRAKR